MVTKCHSILIFYSLFPANENPDAKNIISTYHEFI